MTTELIGKILQQYGYESRNISPAQTGYRNMVYTAGLQNGKTVNLILYKSEPGILVKIRNANTVGNYAAAHGLPVRQTVDPRIVRLQADGYLKYGALYNYLPGQTIAWEGYTMAHIKHLGAAMSQLHHVLLPLRRGDLPSVVLEYSTINQAMYAYFSEAGVQDALAGKLGLAPPKDFTRYHKLLRKLDRATGQQALHMDFVRGNILFQPDSAEITGILDFEKAAWGHPMFDIARTLAFLLVDCKYKDAAKVRKYFVQSGYNKRGPGSFQPGPAFELLVQFFLLYDFYKFLLHNPYEQLHANEHFVRTRGYMLERQVISNHKMLN